MDGQSEVTSPSGLESRLGEINLPMEEIVPGDRRKWLDAFASSNGTTSELLLSAALVSTSALDGHSTVKVFGSYEQKANLYLVATARSGTGKMSTCHKGCIGPIVGALDSKIESSMVIDETSSSGLFNHFVAGSHFLPFSLVVRHMLRSIHTQPLTNRYNNLQSNFPSSQSPPPKFSGISNSLLDVTCDALNISNLYPQTRNSVWVDLMQTLST